MWKRQSALASHGPSRRLVARRVVLPCVALAAMVGPSLAAEFLSPVPESGFATDEAPWFRRAFDVVAADMDLDGDPDLLVNWHHHEPLELYENVGGRFVLRNPPASDATGIYDNPGVPTLYASERTMAERIEALGRPGLYVWHDENRGASWRFLWVNDGDALAGLQLQIETSLPIEEMSGLEGNEHEKQGPRRLRVALPKSVTNRSFAIRVLRVATQLKLTAATEGEALPPIYVGPRLAPLRDKDGDAEVQLWKADPHGMAWVDVEEGGRPEIFITRGGLGGTLKAPAEGKRDRYYVALEESPIRYRRAHGVGPKPNYTRGRRVEWVDVDGAGTLALSIAVEHGANQFLVRDAKTGALRDRAAQRGLDLEGAAIQTWGDLDGDGKQDLYFVEGTRIDVLRNTGHTFERIRGDTLGLTLLPVKGHAGVIDSAALRLSDFDNDGALDLWLFGYGREGETQLFRRTGKGFENVTQSVGLGDASKTGAAVLIDLDNDGYDDVVSFGEASAIWKNRAGRSFERRPFRGRGIAAAAVADFDGDGWSDLAAMSRQRVLLRNNASGPNRSLVVVIGGGVRQPIGARVRALYRDGSIRAQRFGSAANSAFSQSLLPLHFGIPVGGRIERIGVRWPGEREEKFYAVPRGSRRLVVEREG